jgi:hypothetical protein
MEHRQVIEIVVSLRFNAVSASGGVANEAAHIVNVGVRDRKRLKSCQCRVVISAPLTQVC